jgi:predicted esterase
MEPEDKRDVRSPRHLHLEVTRTARVSTLGGASQAEASCWWVLHGYRQLAPRFLRRFQDIATQERKILAPEALSRFYLAPGDRSHDERDPVGASWMTREDRDVEIRDYVGYLDRALEDPRLDGKAQGVMRTVLGFSQGGHTAARWIALSRHRFCDRLILWGVALPPDLPDAARERFAKLELILVRGDSDALRSREEEEREERILRGWGVEWRELRHPRGHRIDEVLLRRLAGEESPQ